jgi:hypothetical protein
MYCKEDGDIPDAFTILDKLSSKEPSESMLAML